jgi:hypothetical protein
LPPARSISRTARARHGADKQAVQVALCILQKTLMSNTGAFGAQLRST